MYIYIICGAYTIYVKTVKSWCVMSFFKALLMDEAAVMRALKRISHEIIEKNNGVEKICLMGIKRRGVPLAQMIADNIAAIEDRKIPVGSVDISLHRDDVAVKFNGKGTPSVEIDFDITNKTVILVDDVLHTGRTVRAALEAVIESARPASVQLAVLIDRGHRELPIRGDYVGKNVPTSKSEIINVNIPPYDNILSAELYEG